MLIQMSGLVFNLFLNTFFYFKIEKNNIIYYQYISLLKNNE
jgi:hypothetical protein